MLGPHFQIAARGATFHLAILHFLWNRDVQVDVCRSITPNITVVHTAQNNHQTTYMSPERKWLLCTGGGLAVQQRIFQTRFRSRVFCSTEIGAILGHKKCASWGRDYASSVIVWSTWFFGYTAKTSKFAKIDYDAGPRCFVFTLDGLFSVHGYCAWFHQAINIHKMNSVHIIQLGVFQCFDRPTWQLLWQKSWM